MVPLEFIEFAHFLVAHELLHYTRDFCQRMPSGRNIKALYIVATVKDRLNYLLFILSYIECRIYDMQFPTCKSDI